MQGYATLNFNYGLIGTHMHIHIIHTHVFLFKLDYFLNDNGKKLDLDRFKLLQEEHQFFENILSR